MKWQRWLYYLILLFILVMMLFSRIERKIPYILVIPGLWKCHESWDIRNKIGLCSSFIDSLFFTSLPRLRFRDYCFVDKAVIISLSMTLEEKMPYLQCVSHTSKDMNLRRKYLLIFKICFFLFSIDNVTWNHWSGWNWMVINKQRRRRRKTR